MTSNDLVSRLQGWIDGFKRGDKNLSKLVASKLIQEAAAEIERLRRMDDADRELYFSAAKERDRLRAALQGMVALAKGQKLDGYSDVVHAERVLAGSPGETRGELCPDCDGWMHAHGLGCKCSILEEGEIR